jgi:predicted  nucleic acid-binding Zn-ribbon protein
MQSERDWIKREMDIADSRLDELDYRRKEIGDYYDAYEAEYGEPSDELDDYLQEIEDEMQELEGRLHDLRRRLTLY